MEIKLELEMEIAMEFRLEMKMEFEDAFSNFLCRSILYERHENIFSFGFGVGVLV